MATYHPAPETCDISEALNTGIYPVILTWRYYSAESFYAAFEPRQPTWRPDRSKWIFRGHGNASWELVPSAYRVRSWEGLEGAEKLNRVHLPHMSDELIFDQEGERRLLIDFLAEVDAAGLPVPQKHVDFQEFRGTNHWSGDWYEDQIPFVALAQHHGLPTRLLETATRCRLLRRSDCVCRIFKRARRLVAPNGLHFQNGQAGRIRPYTRCSVSSPCQQSEPARTSGCVYAREAI
jgi:hypothetical protein